MHSIGFGILILILQIINSNVSIRQSCDFQSTPITQFYTESQKFYHYNHLNKYDRSNEYNGPIRIHFEYTHSSKINRYQGYILDLIHSLKIQLSNYINVKRSQLYKNIIVPRYCIDGLYTFIKGKKVCSKGCLIYTSCINTVIPDKFLKACLKFKNENEYITLGKDGVGAYDTDLVFIVDIETCNSNKSTRARTCFHDEYDRPILGSLQICIKELLTDENPLLYINELKHQLIHALGFDATKFAFFRDDKGEPLVERNSHGLPLKWNYVYNLYDWNDKIMIDKKRNRHSVGSSFYVIFKSFVMPKTLDAARRHFNCQELDGVDFENRDVGIYANHFDELIYGTELMTSVSNKEFDVMSSLTLAFLEDTGWYTVNYRIAENYEYGFQTGCIFALGGCFDFIRNKTPNISPFCNNAKLTGNIYRCFRHDFFYYCGFQKLSHEMFDYIYFIELPGIDISQVHLYYGLYKESEYCPTLEIVRHKDYQNSICYDTYNSIKIPTRETLIHSYYGADSECFENSIKSNPEDKIYGAACHKIKPLNNTHFYIYLMDMELICQYGKTIDIIYQTYNLTIECSNIKVGVRIQSITSNISYSIVLIGLIFFWPMYFYCSK